MPTMLDKTQADKNVKAQRDDIIKDIASYVANKQINNQVAYQTAHYCLIDTLACGFLALKYPQCVKLLGPIVEGANLKNGAKVPGTSYQLDPVQAAFNIGCMVRWLDFNDTWLAAEWGHPSDNLGSILATMDYLNRAKGKKYTVSDILTAMVKAHEIQGVLALKNSFNRVGLDHVLLVRIASAAVTAGILGLSEDKIADVISHAWLDGGALRTYRHAPNTGSRKSWAAGDATSRAVRLALMVEKGEMGYQSPLTAKQWGFQDVLFNNQDIVLERELDSYVMENILFKISFPAEFHAQTAVECAFELHNDIKDKLDQIKQINITTHESAIRIISKSGELHNPADRDHCLQYMIAIGLIYGQLEAKHYEGDIASNPLIDEIREKMVVTENKQYSIDYLDSTKRSISNAIEIEFDDGSKTKNVEVHYPIGHKNRREEGIPNLIKKFQNTINNTFNKEQQDNIFDACLDYDKITQLKVDEFVELFVKND